MPVHRVLSLVYYHPVCLGVECSARIVASVNYHANYCMAMRRTFAFASSTLVCLRKMLGEGGGARLTLCVLWKRVVLITKY